MNYCAENKNIRLTYNIVNDCIEDPTGFVYKAKEWQDYIKSHL